MTMKKIADCLNRFGKFFISIVEGDDDEQVIRFHLKVKRTGDGSVTVSLLNCQHSESHWAVFKPNAGGDWELGELGIEQFGRCVLFAVVSSTMPEMKGKVEVVDDRLYLYGHAIQNPDKEILGQ